MRMSTHPRVSSVADIRMRWRSANAIRSTALRHALLSYLFGAVILGTAVNFIVSLSNS